MKREGHLWGQICNRDNLQLAFQKAARGKRDRTAVIRYTENLEKNLQILRKELLEERYTLGDYNRFVIHDPKLRVIHAAGFKERVLQHAVMNVCERVFEKRQIYHSYACRVGKGQYKALEQAMKNASCYPYYFKFDIRKYFDSISQIVLLEQLRGMFKDRQLGMSFLGYRVYPKHLLLTGKSWQRFKKKFRNYVHLWSLSYWDDRTFQRHLEPLLAFVIKADNTGSRLDFMKEFRASAIGLEPG